MSFEVLKSILANIVQHFEENKNHLPFKEEDFEKAKLTQLRAVKKKFFARFLQLIPEIVSEKIPTEVVENIFDYSLTIETRKNESIGYDNTFILFPFPLSAKDYDQLSRDEKELKFDQETNCEIISKFSSYPPGYDTLYFSNDDYFNRQLERNDSTKIELSLEKYNSLDGVLAFNDIDEERKNELLKS